MIMKVTATMEMRMPAMMFGVSASPKMTVPTRIAVIGSKTPNTDAFVAPMFLVATARDAVETIVGRTARPMRLHDAIPQSLPAIRSAPENKHLPMKKKVPVSRA